MPGYYGSGSDEWIRILPATQSIASGAEIFPGVMLFFIGSGEDGESLLRVSPSSSIRRTGFGRIPRINLQAEEARMAKGRKYLWKTWLSFGECRPNIGLQEAAFKNPSDDVICHFGETERLKRNTAHAQRQVGGGS